MGRPNVRPVVVAVVTYSHRETLQSKRPPTGFPHFGNDRCRRHQLLLAVDGQPNLEFYPLRHFFFALLVCLFRNLYLSLGVSRSVCGDPVATLPITPFHSPTTPATAARPQPCPQAAPRPSEPSPTGTAAAPPASTAFSHAAGCSTPRAGASAPRHRAASLPASRTKPRSRPRTRRGKDR